MHGFLFQDALKVRMAFKAELAAGALTEMQGSVPALAFAGILGVAWLAGALGKRRVKHRLEELRIL